MPNTSVDAIMIRGGTVIDGSAPAPLPDHSVWVESGRIKAIAPTNSLPTPPGARVVDASGAYLIPGLMNANVHLFGLHALEGYARYYGRYEDLIAESAQVALKHGLTTVFDTWGPRRFLMTVRDRINAGALIGSRIFCAGNIVGFDGPFSADFFPKAAEVASAALINRVNSIWVENVGRHLMWLPPEQVAQEVRAYISRGIDFIKYASNEHWPGAFIAFSPHVQRAIVDVAHEAGLTAQAHSMSVEGLRLAVEAGCDLVTHCNITGETTIPDATLQMMATRGTGAVVFPFTAERLDSILNTVSDMERAVLRTSDVNARNLISCGAPLMLANDGSIVTPEWSGDPQFGNSWVTAPGGDNLCQLSTGHFAWFKAMEEKGCAPMEMLKAATINIATAYGKARDLGTLEVGKIADILVLEANPLRAASNYGKIRDVIKDGRIVDREALPERPVVTAGGSEVPDEQASYVPFVRSGKFPMCPLCVGR